MPPEMLDFLRAARRSASQHRRQRRHRLRQDDVPQRALELHSRATSASSRSKTPPNCCSSRSTSCAWKRGRRTSKAPARSASATSCSNALRMRPDRIIVGECRGGEALDMLQAMNTGHDGSLTTIHANSAARRALAHRNDGADGRLRPAGPRDPRADRRRRRPRRADGAHARRLAQGRRASAKSSAWKATS